MKLRPQFMPPGVAAALLFVWASHGVAAQDMIGPSGDTPSTAPAMEQQPEQQPEQRPDAAPADTTGAAVVGEDDVLRATPEAAEDAFPSDAGPATEPVDAAQDTAVEADAAPDTDPLAAASDTQPVFDYPAQWQLFNEAAEHAQAVEIARLWAADAARQYGEGADETFIPLVRLGESYEANKELVLAASAYADAIAVAELRRGVFDMAMVEPLVGLARVLSARGEHEAAVSSLMRAKDITHRNLGIFNAEQTQIVSELTDSYVNIGEVRQATREQRFLFGAREKQFGPQSPELVPALHDWAQWNARIQRFPDARKLFYRAIDILEAHYGPNDLRIVETLNLIAHSFYLNATTTYPREGAQALRRAVEIFEAQEYVDQADLLRAKTKLADWYLIAGSRSRAVDAYEEAIAEARATGVDEETIDARYGIPRMLRTSKTPIGLWPHEQEKLGEGPRHVILEFDVDKRGRPRNIRVVEDTINLVDTVKLLRNRVAATVYRPRFVDGKAVATYGVRQQFDFSPQRDVADVGTSIPADSSAGDTASP